MEWKLIDVVQETDHRFLNFFTLTYEVTDHGVKKIHPYFMASRRSKEKLRALCQDYRNPDGVLIPLYYIDEKTGKISLLMTEQFREPVGARVRSFTAGLRDGDEDIIETAKREAKEEAGAIITDIEVITKGALSTSGLSDEMNAMVLARIVSFEGNSLEEFEDITTKLIPLKDLLKMMEEENNIFPMSTRLMILYLSQRFSALL